MDSGPLRRWLSGSRRRRRGRQLDAGELVRRVERIAIAARRRSDSSRSGAYRAVFHGRGMEFSEVREYLPGDDVRSIDWNVTARAGAPFVKLYREERDVTVHLAIDLSASEDFGSGLATKRDLAAEAAATILLAAAQNRDRFGAVLFTDQVERVHAPRHGKAHALAIVRDILSRPLTGFGTDLAAGLRAVGHLARSRGIIVVMSDFRATGFERELARLAGRHDVIAIALSDPAEKELPVRGLFRVQDAETGKVRVVDASSEATRRAWRFDAAARAAPACGRYGIDLLTISANRSPARELSRFFKERSRRPVPAKRGAAR